MTTQRHQLLIQLKRIIHTKIKNLFSFFYLWNTKDNVKKNVRDILHASEWRLSLSCCLTSPIGFHWLKKECHTGLDSWNNTNFIFSWQFPLKGQFTQNWNHLCHHLLIFKKDILRIVSVVFGPYKSKVTKTV